MSDELLQAAAELARLMGESALARYRTGVTVETKGDGSPVTAADRDAERLAREWLARRFPRDGILGEEFGEQPSEAGRRWLLDPIDGTKSYVRGVPLWGSLVAVCDRTAVLAGAACFPAVNEVVAAAQGHGCWWNNARCTVSAVSEMRNATVLTTDTRISDGTARGDGWRALADRAFIGRTWGDAFGYLLVATGRAEVMVDPLANPWDAAPFVPIVEEAGGVFTDWSGQRTAFGGSAIATNQALAQEARALLQQGSVQ